VGSGSLFLLKRFIDESSKLSWSFEVVRAEGWLGLADLIEVTSLGVGK